MKNRLDSTFRMTTRRSLSRLVAVGATSALLVAGVSLVSATAASAAGSTSNTISVSGAPSAGSEHGSYTPTASATSKDTVAITLDKDSSGCSLASGKVTFTGSGTCLIDFNDAGNTTYAAAAQVQQSIKVYSSNTISVSAAPSSGGAGGSYSPGASATSGDAVVRTLSSSSTGCTLSGVKVSFTGLGTCHVLFNDPGNGAFAPAAEVEQSIEVHSGNYISASTPPAAAAINATYSASASATSGDTVVITLDGSSTGCSIDKNKVTFTGNGICKVNFNDPGNGAYAAAKEVQQQITAGSGLLYQSTLSLFSTGGTYGKNLTLISSGGSGSGAVTYGVTNIGTAGCSITNGVLSSTRVGTCTVTVYKAGDSTYHSATSLATTVTISAQYPKKPTALRVAGTVWTGRTTAASIVGRGFYGRPRIMSNIFGTRITVSRDSGRVLTVRVRIAGGTPKGIHRFTIVFAHGERTTVRYLQR
jgi:large repetitive protein